MLRPKCAMLPARVRRADLTPERAGRGEPEARSGGASGHVDRERSFAALPRVPVGVTPRLFALRSCLSGTPLPHSLPQTGRRFGARGEDAR
jgi:hypothetical protein